MDEEENETTEDEVGQPLSNCSDDISAAIRAKQSVLCVGLNPSLERLPLSFVESSFFDGGGGDWSDLADLFTDYNCRIIEAVAPYVIAIKLIPAFYEQYGASGLRAFERTLEFANDIGLICITDAGCGGGGNTAKAYARGHVGQVIRWDPERRELVEVYGPMATDALTIDAAAGDDCVQHYLPALRDCGTGIFVIVNTPFSPEATSEQMYTAKGVLVWEELAKKVDVWGRGTEGKNGFYNVGAVVSISDATEATRARKLMPHAWFLVNGYGAKNSGAAGIVAAADQNGFGVIVNSSQRIVNAWNGKDARFFGLSTEFAKCAGMAAQAARFDLNLALRRAGKGRGVLWDSEYH